MTQKDHLPIRWNPPTVAAPIGKYSHLTLVPEGSELVFISGQVGNAPNGSLAESSLDQTVRALTNIDLLLDSLGSGPRHLVRLLTFVSGTANLPGFYAGRDEVFARWFPDGAFPGHSLAVVAALASPQLFVEIEGWAAVPTRAGVEGS